MPGRRFLPILFAVSTVAAGLAIVLVLVPPDPVRAAPVDPPPGGGAGGAGVDAGVEVSGVGTATGRPDVLRVTVGVEVSEDTVDAALAGADQAARRVLDAVRAAGVPGEDVRTVNVSLYPDHGPDGMQVAGYVARHDVEVTLRDVDAAGAVLGRLVEAGGDAARVQGLAYALEDDAAVQEQARERAFADARRRAEQYARLVGRELGEIVAVRETAAGGGPLPYAGDAAGAAMAETVPLAPGSTAVTVTATVRWSLR